MKKIILTQFLILLIIGCGKKNTHVNMSDLLYDSLSQTLIVKKTGNLFTGEAVVYETDYSGFKYLYIKRTFKNGKDSKPCIMYYPNGKILLKGEFHSNKLNGKVKCYDENGNLLSIANFVNNIKNGAMQTFRLDGTLQNESEYINDSLISTIEFDSFGKRILTILDKLELIDFDSGFLDFYDYTSRYNKLFQPTIILKFKNKSNEPISEEIKINVVFIANDEELSQERKYFQYESGIPLNVGIERQIAFRSLIGYPNIQSYQRKKAHCNIYLNDKFYKRIDIKNKILLTDRISR